MPTMIHRDTVSASDTDIIDYNPLSVLQLSFVAADIIERLVEYRPEFARIAALQRNAGTRITELFTPSRWNIVNNTIVQIQPQKGNALRILTLSDIGYESPQEFEHTLQDMGRLPQRQYERAFAYVVREVGLWRLYENGFLRPSTHMLRHLRIKELHQKGFSNEYIATWIGEKNPQNLDYYLNSKYFI